MENRIDDVAVIGLGPSGIAASIYLKRSGLEPLCFEQGEVGGKLNEIKEIENYPGYIGDGKGLAQKFKEQLDYFHIAVKKESVLSITKEESGLFTIKTTQTSYAVKAVIIASGIRERPYEVPNSHKYDDNGLSRCAECDGPFYKNKPVAVLGNSLHAIKDAEYLSSIDGHVFFLAPDEKIDEDPEMKKLLAKPNVELIAGSDIIDSDGQLHLQSLMLKDRKTGATKTIEVSALFILLGSTPMSEFLGYMDVADQFGHLIVDQKMQTKEAGLFAAGDVRTTQLRQVITSVSDGGLAAINVRSYLQSLKEKK